MQYDEDAMTDCTATISAHRRHLTTLNVIDFKKFCTTVKSKPGQVELRTKNAECPAYLEKLYAQSDNGSILKNFGALYLKSMG